MSLNLDLVGKTLAPLPFAYDRQTVILYALGIGCGAADDDLRFVFEEGLEVFPTFVTTAFIRIFMADFLPLSGIDLESLLHAEHHIVIHAPLPPEGTIHTSLTWEAAYDKGDKGALLKLSSLSSDAAGECLFENHALFLDRKAGNFSGPRGPKAVKDEPPAQAAPAFSIPLATGRQQAALFRLSGDRNPLHIDPRFARRAGFERPILHGLCSFGVACRALLAALCDNDPSRLIQFGGRFSGVVFPGDTLTTEAWPGPVSASEPGATSGTYRYRTTNQHGREIVSNGRAALAPPPHER